MLSDPIADMLTRIRNATLVHKSEVDVPGSKFKKAIADVLTREGYIKGYEVLDEGGKPVLRIGLKYGPGREQVIRHIERISKPGRRVYAAASEIPSPRRGLGLVVVSTPKGVLAGRDARRNGVGGELLLEVW